MRNYRKLASLAVVAAGLTLFYNTSSGSRLGKMIRYSVRSEVKLPAAQDAKLNSDQFSLSDTAKWLFPCDEKSIKKYTALHTSAAPLIDGKLDEAMWQKIERSPRFTDLISGGETLYDTRAAVAWDDDNLYIAFWMEKPFVQGTFKNHNDLIYRENDAEVFIALNNAYYEFEINALNTRYEAFFMWKEAYEKNGFAAIPNLSLTNPLVRNFNGVGFKNHPRGLRYGSWDFKFPGMQSGVHVDGTLNEPKDRDRKWTVELAFPWKGMEWLRKGDERAIPPKNNDVWRIDFTRFNPYKEAPPAKDSGGWAWSSHGVWDSHVPECFPKITFSRKKL